MRASSAFIPVRLSDGLAVCLEKEDMAKTKISKEFLAWLAPMLVPLPELPDGMIYHSETLKPAVRCSQCGRVFEWPLDVEEYDPDVSENHYCGGSPRCCP